MEEIKRIINGQLYFEFGFGALHHDAGLIAENWPFNLIYLGQSPCGNDACEVFGFDAEGEKYYAVAGEFITCIAVSGVDFSNLKRQIQGGRWIESRGPVSLHETPKDQPDVPMLAKRKARIGGMTRAKSEGRKFEILEGLYFAKTKDYVALVQYEGEKYAQLLGDKISLKNIPFEGIPSRRRLAIGIGLLIERGRLA